MRVPQEREKEANADILRILHVLNGNKKSFSEHKAKMFGDGKMLEGMQCINPAQQPIHLKALEVDVAAIEEAEHQGKPFDIRTVKYHKRYHKLRTTREKQTWQNAELQMNTG